MGNRSSAATWSVDDWAFGTGQNAVPLDAVIEETSKIPAKYFGGKAIGNDPSMHQMQNDLLSFDETLKNVFRRKKNKKSNRNIPPTDDQYEYSDRQVVNSPGNSDYLAPIFDGNSAPSLTPIPDESDTVDTTIWRCGYCTAENKVGQHICRQCRQAETRL